MKAQEMLGCTVKDSITGFIGVVTGAASYLTGCDQVSVTPSTTEVGKYPEGVWLDVNRAKVLSEIPPMTIDTTTDKGAMSSPSKH